MASVALKRSVWGQVVNGEIVYPLHRYQSRLLRSKARFTAALAGTGGGKTVCGPLWVMRQIQRCIREWERGERDFDRDPIMGLVVAPTHPIMDRATAPTFVRMFEGTDLEGRWVPSRNVYLLPHGLGKIWFLSADNPQGLEGGQFDFAWLDEGGQLTFDAWIAIQGRVGQKQAPVLITTTPYGTNWIYYKFYHAWRNGDKTYNVIQWPSFANPSYPKEEYERAKRTMTKARAAQRYDGLFTRMEGLVYPDLQTCSVDDFDLDDVEGQLVGGIDFGWSVPFAALAGVRDADDVLWVGYERYKRQCLIARHSKYLPRGVSWWADPARPESINELRINNHTVRPALNDLLIGIDAVSARVATERIKISKSLIALWAESEEYRFDAKEDGSTSEKPIKEFDHAMDALRYMVMGLDRHKVARLKKSADDVVREQEQRQQELEARDLEETRAAEAEESY